MIPTIKARILAILTDRAAFAEVQLSYAQPGPRLEQTSAWFGSARATHDIHAIVAGRKPRDETVEASFYVYVWLLAGTPQEAEAKAFELVAEVEDALADDPKLDLAPAVYWARFKAIEATDCGPRENGGDAAIESTIEIKTRLS